MHYKIVGFASAALIVVMLGGLTIGSYGSSENDWLDSFNLEECNLSSTGSNSYFFLRPGYQLTLEGQDDGNQLKLVITVLNETRIVDGIETRVVEERESENGELTEVSMNYFAICAESRDIFYFGEEVDMYSDGEVESHEGQWLAGEGGAEAGLLYPADPKVGMKFYQEIAPGVAEDRAEILSLDETLDVPAGNFDNVLKVEETTPLEPREKEYKYYAPGVGLLQDEDLKLTAYSVPEESQMPVPNELRSQPQSITIEDTAIEVQVNSTSTVSDFVLDEQNKRISFNVDAAGSGGVTEIMIGRVLEGPYAVSIDGEVVDNVELSQSPETGISALRVSHEGNSHVITVAGTNIVPEFPLQIMWMAAAVVGGFVFVARFKSARGLN